MRFMGKTGASISGVMGPSGPKGGFILISARILYHCRGISSSDNSIFLVSIVSSFLIGI
jgi:hypothetical protein